eukprot:jgi/Picre1/30174/NNA_005543.t1
MAPQDGGRKQTRSLLVLVWRAYLNKLQKDPLLTKSLTAGVLNGLSNVVAQKTRGHHNKRHVSWHMVMKYVAFGIVWAGPSVHYWQNALERLFLVGGENLEHSWALRKTIIDQLVLALLPTLYFYPSSGTSLNRRISKILYRRLKKNMRCSNERICHMAYCKSD